MLYEVITVVDGDALFLAEELGLPGSLDEICPVVIRITSYNVCYTKLLRLVETRAEEAILVAERMRKMIEEKLFGRESGLDIRLTISIGIAAFPEHATTT